MIGVTTIVIAIADDKLQDKRRQQDCNDQQLADKLYYQDVLKTYVKDISDILFVSNNSFLDNVRQ
jgi:hypothetical protein